MGEVDGGRGDVVTRGIGFGGPDWPIHSGSGFGAVAPSLRRPLVCSMEARLDGIGGSAVGTSEGPLDGGRSEVKAGA